MTVALYASLIAFLFLALSVNVVRNRLKLRVALGDGGKEAMRQAVRAHGNLAEYAPIFLLLLGLAEYQGLPAWGVHLLGATFLLGRLSHAYGVAFRERYSLTGVENLAYRTRGMIVTFVCTVSAAIFVLVQYILTMLS
ncbi:glutathione metabolism protein [Cohaesibacter sp. CAU 1516]|uniref:MAPEG family protein n=1 Tax=Cohaesibacter sp. CAU 1516 TaxID=2576038 RepID=UPI0010FD5B05|nr:MAPEG family protein [Cohaesibacter sp. CAU 1516]TLP44896.1 glutathione metabolism protein [Cohaesibacter sp. CAU 1516]